MSTETITERPTLAGVARYFGSMGDADRSSQPWVCSQWLVTTNGVMLLGRKGTAGVDSVPERLRSAVDNFLSSPLLAMVDAAMNELIAFAGDVFFAGDCKECLGSGLAIDSEFITCQHCGQLTLPECHACGGDGREDLPVQYAYVCGVPVNPAYLAYGLAAMTPCERVTVGIVGPEYRRAIVIESDSDRFVLQQMRDPEQPDLPRWPKS